MDKLNKRNQMLNIKKELDTFAPSKSVGCGWHCKFRKILFKNGLSIIFDDYRIVYLRNIKDYYFELFFKGYNICSFPNGTKILDCSGLMGLNKCQVDEQGVK